MNGMLPPVPMYIASRPKNSRDAVCIDSASHGAISGAFQPPIDDSTFAATRAPYGGSRVSAATTASAARCGSVVGARRNDSFRLVYGRNVLPAAPQAGRPSAPVMLSVGRQVLFSSSSYGSFETARMPWGIGNFSCTVLPSTAAVARVCSRRSGGIGALSSSTRIAPDVAHSTRPSNSRSTRKLEGTMPLAEPECTPSDSTSAVSVTIRLPRSDVVHQSWS